MHIHVYYYLHLISYHYLKVLISSLSLNEGQCYGCESNMKHPNADAYAGGHSKVCNLKGECLGPNIAVAETMDDVSVMFLFPGKLAFDIFCCCVRF